MYKFIFELITDPLGLPISPIWEYAILLLLNEIAFRIAWNVSPGGKWGSEIHWAVRIPTFLLIWLITYSVIYVVEWILLNKVLALSIFVGVIAFTVISSITILTIRKRKRYKE